MRNWGLLISTVVVLVAASGCSQNKERTQDPRSQVMSYTQFSQLHAADTTSDPNCDKTCQERRTEFKYVVYVGKQIYCYWDLKKSDTQTDFDALATSLENSITTQSSLTDYYLALRRWASAFHDGHVNVMPKDDLTGLEIYTAPIRVEVLAPATDHEKVIVSQVNGAQGVAVGDEITAINGVPIRDALTKAAAEGSSGSTERMRRFWAGRRLVDVMGAQNGSQAFKLTINPIAGGAKTDISLFRNVEIDAKSGGSSGDSTGLENITARILPNSVGYLRLDAFGGSQDDVLISAAMERLAQTSGLVIDLRHNGGGDLSGDRIIERLASQTVVRYKRSERLSDYTMSQRPELFDLLADATGQFALWHNLDVEPLEGHHYSKPVIALISPYCFSACDTFSAALKAGHLATFVGEGTGGGTGTPLVFDLPVSPFQFRYSVIRGQTSSGDLIEGVGTSPDVYLEPTAEDRARQKDTQLEKALELLQAQGADHSNVPPVHLQDLSVSPTRAENDFLLKISKSDER